MPCNYPKFADIAQFHTNIQQFPCCTKYLCPILFLNIFVVFFMSVLLFGCKGMKKCSKTG